MLRAIVLMAPVLLLVGCETTRTCDVKAIPFESPELTRYSGKTVYLNLVDDRTPPDPKHNPAQAIFDTLRNANSKVNWVRAPAAPGMGESFLVLKTLKFRSIFVVAKSGIWNGEVQLAGELRQKVGEPRQFTIHKVVSFPNEFGYTTADDALMTAFRQAMIDLVDEIDRR